MKTAPSWTIGLQLNRRRGILIAMLERYGKADDLRCHSAVVRIFALLHFVSQGGLEPWVSKVPGRTDEVYVDSRVIAAAAVVGLDSMLRFPVEAFMRQVRRIQAGEDR